MDRASIDEGATRVVIVGAVDRQHPGSSLGQGAGAADVAASHENIVDPRINLHDGRHHHRGQGDRIEARPAVGEGDGAERREIGLAGQVGIQPIIDCSHPPVAIRDGTPDQIAALSCQCHPRPHGFRPLAPMVLEPGITEMDVVRVHPVPEMIVIGFRPLEDICRVIDDQLLSGDDVCHIHCRTSGIIRHQRHAPWHIRSGIDPALCNDRIQPGLIGGGIGSVPAILLALMPQDRTDPAVGQEVGDRRLQARIIRPGSGHPVDNRTPPDRGTDEADRNPRPGRKLISETGMH